MAFFGIDKIFHTGKRGLVEYLYFRIFLVSFILLIIPLIFHNFIMYQRDYNDRKDDFYLTLNVLAQNRVHSLTRHFQTHMRALDLLLKYVQFTGNKSKEEKDKINATLSALEEKSIATHIFYVEESSANDFVCIYSSDPSMIGKSYPELKRITNQEEFILFSQGFLGCKNCLYFCKAVVESKNRPTGILISAIPGDHFITHVQEEEFTPYPLTLSLVGEDQSVIISSYKPLIGQKLKFFKEDRHHKKNIAQIALYPEKDKKNAFRFFAHDKRGFAIILPFPQSNLFILLDVLETELEALQYREYFLRSISFTFFLLFFGGGAAILFIRKLALPYNQLYGVMEEVSQGNEKARYHEDRWGFEVNILGNIFNKTMDSVIEQSEDAERARLGKHILEQELQIGRKIQMSMLPLKVLEFPGVDIGTAYVPAKEVGGDFYDLFVNVHQGKEKLAIVIADASGKGISACLYSLSIRSLIRSIGSTNDSISEILTHSNNLFYQDSGASGMFVTAWFGLYDPASKVLSYSSCGHYPAFLFRQDGSYEKLVTSGIALGVEIFEKTETKSITLTKGDLLILYTDGLIEANKASGEFYGKERLLQFLLSEVKDKSCQQIIDALKKEVATFTSNADPFDDLTVLALRIL